MSVPLSSYEILLLHKIHKKLYHLVWNSHNQTHFSESHRKVFIIRKSLLSPHYLRGLSNFFLLANEDRQLDLSNKLIFIFGGEKSLTRDYET